MATRTTKTAFAKANVTGKYQLMSSILQTIADEYEDLQEFDVDGMDVSMDEIIEWLDEQIEKKIAASVKRKADREAKIASGEIVPKPKKPKEAKGPSLETVERNAKIVKAVTKTPMTAGKLYEAATGEEGSRAAGLYVSSALKDLIADGKVIKEEMLTIDGVTYEKPKATYRLA